MAKCPAKTINRDIVNTIRLNTSKERLPGRKYPNKLAENRVNAEVLTIALKIFNVNAKPIYPFPIFA